jgi:hypothetical protein
MMPEEQPSKSEELLQRYAKERREQGGDFSLHPATRRMLQGEVTRTFNSRGGEARPGWLTMFWRGRFALGVGLALVMTAGIWIFVSQQNTRTETRFAKADVPARGSDEWKDGVDRRLAEKPLSTVEALGVENKPLRPVAEPNPARAEKLARKEARSGDGVSLALNAPAQKPGGETGAVSYFALQSSTLDDKIAGLAPGVGASGVATEKMLVASRPVFNTSTVSGASAGAVSLKREPGEGMDSDSFRASLAATAPATPNAPVVDGNVQSINGVVITAPVNAGKSFEKQKKVDEVSELAKSQTASQGFGARGANPTIDRARSVATAAPAAPATVAPLDYSASLDNPAEKFGRSADTREALASVTAAPRFGGGAPGVRYYRLDSSGSEKPAEAKQEAETLFERKKPAETMVLNSFVIQQNGSAVRVVDADGSIYVGTVETPVRAGFDFDGDGSRPVEKDFPRANLPVKRESLATAEEFSFRVTGSNVTLRENVVMNGRWVLRSQTNRAAMAGRGGSARGLAGGASSLRATPEPEARLKADVASRRAAGDDPNFGFAGEYGFTTNSAATIEGTVRIGATNEQWFRARRAP